MTMKKLRWKIKNNVLENEDGKKIAHIESGTSDMEESIIENAPDAIGAIAEFVNEVNSGRMKPRATVKKFEKILEKIEN